MADAELEAKFNRQTHGLDTSGLLDTLERLFADGLLEAEKWTTHNTDARLGALSKEQIARALDESSPGMSWYSHYGLTAAGANAWEYFVRPNWNRFVLEERNEDDPKFWILTCLDRKFLESFRRSLAAHEGTDAPMTAEIEQIGSWQATYWKSLPSGFRLTYEEAPESELPAIGGKSWEKRKLEFMGLDWLREWWCPRNSPP